MTFIFDHIFKTAGTTFHGSYLPAAFCPQEIAVVNGFRDGNRADLERLARLPEGAKASLKVIAGHNTGSLRPFFPDAKFLSLVRDPVDRAVSAYLHAKHHRDAWEHVGWLITQRNIGLAEFVGEDVFAREYAEYFSLHDWQAKTILGPHFSPSLSQEEIAGIARSRYHVIGTTDQFERFLMFLHLTENFPLVLFQNRLVRKERVGFEPDVEALAVIERCNRVDALLYETMAKVFDQAVSAIWDAQAESEYQEYLSRLREFQAGCGGSY